MDGCKEGGGYGCMRGLWVFEGMGGGGRGGGGKKEGWKDGVIRIRIRKRKRNRKRRSREAGKEGCIVHPFQILNSKSYGIFSHYIIVCYVIPFTCSFVSFFFLCVCILLHLVCSTLLLCVCSTLLYSTLILLAPLVPFLPSFKSRLDCQVEEGRKEKVVCNYVKYAYTYVFWNHARKRTTPPPSFFPFRRKVSNSKLSPICNLES